MWCKAVLLPPNGFTRVCSSLFSPPYSWICKSNTYLLKCNLVQNRTWRHFTKAGGCIFWVALPYLVWEQLLSVDFRSNSSTLWLYGVPTALKKTAAWNKDEVLRLTLTVHLRKKMAVLGNNLKDSSPVAALLQCFSSLADWPWRCTLYLSPVFSQNHSIWLPQRPL